MARSRHASSAKRKRPRSASVGDGPYNPTLAARHFGHHLEGVVPDHLRELTYTDRKTLHNFKYFTWIEQQQKDVDDLRRLWDPDFWTETFAQAEEWDRQIEAFNARL